MPAQFGLHGRRPGRRRHDHAPRQSRPPPDRLHQGPSQPHGVGGPAGFGYRRALDRAGIAFEPQLVAEGVRLRQRRAGGARFLDLPQAAHRHLRQQRRHGGGRACGRARARDRPAGRAVGRRLRRHHAGAHGLAAAHHHPPAGAPTCPDRHQPAAVRRVCPPPARSSAGRTRLGRPRRPSGEP
jgi:hypothetical protein